MQNKLLERVESLLKTSDNIYDVTLHIAILSKRKKNIEDLSSTPAKENMIVQTINEVFERQRVEKENFIDK